MSEVIIGVDIGGTSIKIGMINENGNILSKWEIPTNLSNSGSTIVKDIWHSIQEQVETFYTTNYSILGIGVGAPGFIDSDNGFVYEAVNIGWKNFHLADQLQALSDIPVFAGNDANIAVLGENWKGSGNQAKNLIAVTLGTGVGGGIIANGRILNGENGTAGEIGHIAVDPNGYPCNCGGTGCLETIASATGIVRQAMDIIKRDSTSMLAKRFNEAGSITAKDVFNLAATGDKDSNGVINRTVDTLGLVIANTAAIINPSKVVIGGGVSKAGDQLLNGIKKAFHNYAIPRVNEVCEIKIAQLGNDAGIIGAAFYVKQKLQNIKF
ncbi:ROK family glucokinase [Virgibacillus byunsanensis]|uniref:Glucokinase n=1 Tax=Virgibacillus byunsanensis TaxID=570945 RepID=A0ABW3LJC2_9BACI